MATVPNIASLPAQSVAVDISSASGVQEILPADSGKGYVVTGFLLSSDAGITITFKAATTALSGAIPVGADDPFDIEDADRGWLHVPAGSALNLDLSGTASVGGFIAYVETSS